MGLTSSHISKRKSIRPIKVPFSVLTNKLGTYVQFSKLTLRRRISKNKWFNPFWHGITRIGENNSFLLRWSLSRPMLMITIRMAEPNGALLDFTSFWKKGQVWSDEKSASADQFWGTRFLSLSPFTRELSHYIANSTGYQKNSGVNFPTSSKSKQQKEKRILEPVMR